MKVLKKLEKGIKDLIPIIWSASIIKNLKAEDEWIDKVKKDKELTKKQVNDAIMLMYSLGIREGEIFIAGCKYGDYTLEYKPNGSVIQKFKRKRNK